MTDISSKIASRAFGPRNAREERMRVVDRTEKEIASAIEDLIEQYPPSAHAAICHAARIALGNAPERWKQ